MSSSIEVAYPSEGRWLTRTSPADRVPSHGTTLLATSHAIDFVPVDDAGRTLSVTAVSLVRSEPADRFPGFSRPVLAPTDGRIVDGEPDHDAYRGLASVVG